ncbi:GGDEF domain-containing protein [Mycobacterium neglectum]|jgi:diguanylate cyclase (GGDEF)-like protein|uniref:GGDEF domain-containing protein n=1 Tax=Mycobacterium neglectum TaxID=242737 RepID=UPI000BFED950|nr:GGDEF domain-containing protein [Mycobacterium neglectum]
MARRVERWWKQPDQYDWLSAYLNERGLQILWRRATFGFTLATGALPIVMLWSPFGPDNPATVAIAFAAAATAVAGGFLWLLRWPTRRQSVIFWAMSTAAIAATSFAFSNPYSGLGACATFAVIGGFAAYFHTMGHVVVNLAVATVCSAILAHRLIAATGDVALAIATLVTVASLNIGVPFGIESLVHTLRSDLRGSDRDPLTGLLNRRSFHRSVYELMMLHRSPAGTYLVMAMIDLDNFKHLNDTRGHAAGDQALVGVSAALHENCSSAAVIGRVGGEEFVVADIDTSPNPAKLAERLRQAIDTIHLPVTASIGTAGAPLETDSGTANLQLIDDLIRTSDAAMYEAKRAGGNQVCHYSTLVPPQ